MKLNALQSHSLARIRLASRDLASLTLYILLGVIFSTGALQLGKRFFLEPLMVAESSLRIAKNVILVEEVLRRLDVEELPTGLIVRAAADHPVGSTLALNRFDRLLQDSLMNERGIKRKLARDIPPLIDPLGGHWIQLETKDGRRKLWIYQPDRLSSSLWFMGPLRVLVLAAGMMAGVLMFLQNQLIWPITKISISLPSGANRKAKLIAEEGVMPVRHLCMGVNRLLERINANEQDRCNLLRGLVHDFSGPTTRLILRVEQLGAELDENPALLESILSDLNHLKNLAEQLRILADAESLCLYREEAALDDLCHRISDRYDFNNIIVQVPRILIRADIKALERALSNLLDNAIEYGAPPVRITANQDREHLFIRIDDHGTGISTPTLLTMPHCSRQGDRERRRHQGLGLAIVEAFCAQHEGELRLSKSPHGGLRAELILPAHLVLHAS
jgi:two-component system osmolarity sensor histidine kinase EnvZ